MACNDGVLCSDINLGERILRQSPRQPNIKVYFEIRPSGALYQDMLTQKDLLGKKKTYKQVNQQAVARTAPATPCPQNISLY